jgi:RNase H-like domain found in reverse transcriptase/Reverse transcriptase (RNA-dependent DNA polymerase)/Integrase zinc binding domain
MYNRVRVHSKKRTRTEEPLVPIVFLDLKFQNKGQKHVKRLKALLDSGASATIANFQAVAGLQIKPKTSTTWSTAGGNFLTSKAVAATFTLPEFSETRIITTPIHIGEQPLSGYDLVIGRDLLGELGIVLDFQGNKIIWGDGEIPMKPRNSTPETSYHIEDPSPLAGEADRLSRINDAKYSKADLPEVVAAAKGLNIEQQQKLLTLLQKFEPLFDGTLGEWKNTAYHIDLKPDAKPYHAKPFAVPRAYESTFKKEVDRLCKIGVLKKVNRSEWAAPTFLVPKKDQSVRFINDFRELNKRIKRKPFPIPKIQDMLLKLEGFQWATSLDLNMGYYHIKLDPASRALCTIVLPWGKYEMQRLPMGLCNSPDIFQEKMAELMDGLGYVLTYIDDLLVLSNKSYEDHLTKLEKVLQRLQDAGLKINANKSFFCQTELEYLGYWITRNGIMPVPKKIEAILKIAEPKTVKQLRSFIGLVNYYRDMWIRRSDILAPLTKLLSGPKNKKWEWPPEAAAAFATIKKIIAQEVLLTHPNFSKPFEIHTDASKYQLGSVISQEGKPIAFYSRKLTPPQLNYTTTEKELLAIVETLKEFRNILLGQTIIVYTDHKNLTYKVFNTERVMRWRLICEEFGAILHYIKGTHNVVADVLSRLHLQPPPKSDPNFEVLDEPSSRPLHEAFPFEELPKDAFPLKLKLIEYEQSKDKDLMAKIRTSPAYSLRSFRGGGKIRKLIVKNSKIVVPTKLQKRLVQWYHYTLCHPGETRTEATISQHFTWNKMREHIRKECSTCHTCQLTKRTKKKYGHLPEKEAESYPWEKLCVDLIGPYTIKRKHRKDELVLWCVTMIDPATGWFEIRELPGTKRADVVANIIEQAWLTRYPWPQEVIFDRGTEFMAEFQEMLINDYGIKRKPITKRNPQANAIVERVHQTIGNMIRTFQVQDLDEDNPWAGILSAVAFAVRATVHTTTQATPMQLVFGRDAILNIQFQANWKMIKNRKQHLIQQNNKRENSKRTPHNYQVGDEVLIKQDQNSKFGSDPYKGPYTITEVRNNGTVRVREGITEDTYNIRMITPYYRS